MGEKAAATILDTADVVFGSPSATKWSNANRLIWLNDAYLFVCASYRPVELDKTETITTTVSTREKSMTNTDVLRLGEPVLVSTGQPLKEINRMDHGVIGGSLTTNTGPPARYFITGLSGGKLELSFEPIPDAAYQILVPYIMRPTALTDAADSYTIINVAWDMVIEALYLAKFAAILRNYDDAKQWTDLASMWAAAAKESSQRTSTMRYDLGPSSPRRSPS